MSAAANLHRASSVILLREARPQGFEVFLARPSDDSPYLDRKYSFPGGPVHKSDHTEAILRRCRGVSGEKARMILGAHLAPPEALGFWISAIRTLFEEVGILIAVKENGEPATSDAELNARLLKVRATRRDGALDFPAFMDRENLYCDAVKLSYFSHWQTSAVPSSSIDSRFFLAALPDNLTPLALPYEVAHGLWLAPERALQLFNRGELPIAFSTFASLRTLADFDDVKRLLKEFQPEIT
jgi:8-oxo-dGTP pyrophosphatase MutT (NUDIX family)